MSLKKTIKNCYRLTQIRARRTKRKISNRNSKNMKMYMTTILEMMVRTRKSPKKNKQTMRKTMMKNKFCSRRKKNLKRRRRKNKRKGSKSNNLRRFLRSKLSRKLSLINLWLSATLIVILKKISKKVR